MRDHCRMCARRGQTSGKGSGGEHADGPGRPMGTNAGAVGAGLRRSVRLLESAIAHLSGAYRKEHHP